MRVPENDKTILFFKLWLKYILEIIERYEGVAQVRNLDNTSLTALRRSSVVGDGLPGLSHRRKSVAKGLGTEFIMSQMSDRGIRKVFDQCSDEFFIAVEEELGKTLKPVRLRESY